MTFLAVQSRMILFTVSKNDFLFSQKVPRVRVDIVQDIMLLNFAKAGLKVFAQN
jgi:hypothetical protein